MKPPAMARISDGFKTMSKAWGMTEPVPDIILSIVWWRASIVAMDAASATTSGSVRIEAPPRYYNRYCA